MITLLTFFGLFLASPVDLTQSIESLAGQMSSSNPTTRAEAYRSLKDLLVTEPTLIESVALEHALTVALQTEYVASHTAQGTKRFHKELIGDLVLPIVAEVCGRSTPLSTAFLSAASLADYNPGTAYSRELAKAGAPMIPVALQLAADPNLMPRLQGYRLLGNVLQASQAGLIRTPLTPQQTNSLIEGLRNGLQDSNPFVRAETIDGIVDARDVGALPLLVTLSTDDPDIGPFSVRATALRAIQQLQQ